MALGIIEPKTSEQPPGTEYLVDTSSTSRTHEYEHTHLKHGSGKVLHPPLYLISIPNLPRSEKSSSSPSPPTTPTTLS